MEKVIIKELPGGVKTVKIGNTDFRVDNFKPKTKQDFLKKYEDLERVVDGKKIKYNPWKFDRDEAWDFLKQFVKKDVK